MASRQAKFKMSRRGVGQLLRSPMVEAEMLRRAEVVKSVAESIAPVGGPGDPHRGLYKESFYTRSTSRGGRNSDRAVAYVGNSSYYARWVEYGGQLVRAHHVLLRAAQSGGH